MTESQLRREHADAHAFIRHLLGEVDRLSRDHAALVRERESLRGELVGRGFRAKRTAVEGLRHG